MAGGPGGRVGLQGRIVSAASALGDGRMKGRGPASFDRAQEQYSNQIYKRPDGDGGSREPQVASIHIVNHSMNDMTTSDPSKYSAVRKWATRGLTTL